MKGEARRARGGRGLAPQGGRAGSLSLSAVAVALLLAGCAVGPRASITPRLDPAAREEVERLAAAALDARHIPGMAVVVLRGDDPLLARGYGVTEVGRAEPVTATTVFQLGSIGKQFLAALIVALAEDGALGLDDPVIRHLPDFSLLPPEVAVRHLLAHTSGIREQFTLPEAAIAYEDLSWTREDLAAAVRRAPVDFPPGSRWSYSNTNYTILALLVERLTGTPYEDVLAERFFRPLGLGSLRQCTPLPAMADEARGHVLRAGTVVPAIPENMEWARGDGGLCGHALDLARWTRWLAGGRVVPARRYEEMTTPTLLAGGRTADYGFALSVVAPDGRRKIAHNGAMAGFSASAAYYPDEELTVVVLTNRGDVRTESLERRIARRLLALPEPALAERALAAAERRRFVGTYDIGVFEVHVVDRDGRLWLEMPPPGPTTALRYLGDGELVSAGDPDAIRLTFGPAAGDGPEPAQEVRLFMAAMHWYGVRRD